MVVTDILDLFLMEVEVAKRAYPFAGLFGWDVPEGQLSIVTSSHYIAMFVRIPLQWETFAIMAGQDYNRINFDFTSFEGSLIKDMHLT